MMLPKNLSIILLFSISFVISANELVNNNAELHFNQIQKAAEQGHRDSQAKLANIFHFGRLDGITRDNKLALYWYQKAAKQGHIESQFQAANLYRYQRQDLYHSQLLNNETIPANWYKEKFATALALYKNAANQGHAKSQLALGKIYAQGRRVQKDQHQALDWYRQAAAQDNSAAQNALGLIYLRGTGVKKDIQQAISWFKKSARNRQYEYQIDGQGQFNLGLMYANGWGVKQDQQHAFNLYRKAADKNIDRAQYNLAVSYEKGEGITQDYHQAAKWYQKIAKRYTSLPLAKINLANLYQQGLGVEKNEQQAKDWYQQAAAKGYPTTPSEKSDFYKKKPPRKSQFTPCKNYFGQTKQVYAMYQQYQTQILASNPEQAGALEREFYDKVSKLTETDSLSISIALDNEIEVVDILMILLESTHEDKGVDIFYQTPNIPIKILADDVPAGLIAAQLIEGLSLQISCQKNWVHIEYATPTNELRNNKPIIISNLIYAKKVQDNETLLSWSDKLDFGDHNGLIYQGKTNDFTPQGKGKYISSKTVLLEGNFENGALVTPPIKNLYTAYDYSVSYTGHYQDGVFHGDGELKKPGLPYYKGEFSYGFYHGRGETEILDDDKKIMSYKGPYVDGQKQAAGICEDDFYQFSCTFDKDRLIKTGSLSINTSF